MRSSGMHNPIVGKVYVGKKFLPLSNVFHYHTFQHLPQGSINHLSLAITLGMASGGEKKLGAKFTPQSSSKMA